VLGELIRRFEQATGLALEFGWTVVEPGHVLDPSLREATVAALTRGRRERERFGFFAALGHEMRSPLTSISGYVQTLLERDLDRATTRAFLETAQLEALRLRRLVDGMYELSLMDLNEPLASGARCDVQNAVERAADAIYPFASLRGTVVMICGRVKSTIPLAGERVVTLFNNVLENAVKHGRAAGRIEIRSMEEGGSVEVFVDDDGEGVAESERTRIFDRGMRGSTAAAPGSGLGLALVHGILQRIGGDIGVSRSPLGGARFTIRIPLHGTPATAGPDAPVASKIQQR
jgi:two-component system phosphate regulon sensor histidine kinase PhoR